jgi:SOS response regulatory protein OraA/RecX
MDQPERLLLMKESKEKEKLSRILNSHQFFNERIQLAASQLPVCGTLLLASNVA